MKRIRVIKPFNRRGKGAEFEAPDGKAAWWVDSGMAEYVAEKVKQAPKKKVVEAEVKK